MHAACGVGGGGGRDVCVLFEILLSVHMAKKRIPVAFPFETSFFSPCLI